MHKQVIIPDYTISITANDTLSQDGAWYKNQGACLGVVKENLLKETTFRLSLEEHVRFNAFFWVLGLVNGRGILLAREQHVQRQAAGKEIM